MLPGLESCAEGPACCPTTTASAKTWARETGLPAAEIVLIGIDEETGLLNDDPNGQWTAYGKGAVTVYEPDSRAVFQHGQRFVLPIESGTISEDRANSGTNPE